MANTDQSLAGYFPDLTFIDLDRRPTLLLHKRSLTHGLGASNALFHPNSALRALPRILSTIELGLTNAQSAIQGIQDEVNFLRPWIIDCLRVKTSEILPVLQFCDMIWDFCLLSEEWIMVSARPTTTHVWKPNGLPSGIELNDTDVASCEQDIDTMPKFPSGNWVTSSIRTRPSTTAPSAPPGTDSELLQRLKLIKHVAVILTNPDGRIIFANDHFYDLTKCSRDEQDGLNWLRIFADEEIPWMERLWADKLGTTDVVTWHAKLRHKWVPPPEYADAGDDEPLWVLGSGHMNLENGITIGATGCFIDISSQKWLEKQQKMLLNQAIDRATLSEQVVAKTLEASINENRFQRLADGLAVGVYIAGADATISYANPSYWTILGIGSSDKTPKIWLEAMEEDQLAQAATGFKKVYEEKFPVEGIEIRLKRRFRPSEGHGHGFEMNGDMPHAWVLFQAYPELGSDGSVLQVVGCVTDISHQKWVEGFLSRQKEDAIAARLEQEKFMDMTSHEMRNPLAAVIHCADEIVDTLTQTNINSVTSKTHEIEDVLRAARTILTCSAHARRIMDDVLTFSKMGARLLKIHPVPCQPVILLDNALAIFQGDAMASAAALNFHVHESIHQLQVDWVFLDHGRCIQIVANLVTNALKFVRNRPTRTVDVTVAASIDQRPMTAQPGFTFLSPGNIKRMATELDGVDGQDLYLHVIIDDTGCGIPASEQTKLFSRFFQASHKTHTQYGGSGLGLSISKELCELQAGQIGFVSEYGKGSTFAFYIRTVRTTAPGSGPANVLSGLASSKKLKTNYLSHGNGSLQSTLPTRSLLSEVDMQPLNVLLVEDNLTNQKVLTRQLQRHKHTVTVASNGIEALDAIKTTEYWRDCSDSPKKLSLVLLDVEMPEMDGLTCIRHIRRLESEGAITKRIPVIAVTANARQEQIDRALEAGMDDVLCKPFQFKELLQVVERLL